MATSTKRPNTISQTTGSYASGKYYRSWYNLSNLKESDKWADCGKSGTLIGGKNGTYPRPAPLKLTNFKFSIPSTAKISKITVYYRHYKSKVSGAYGSFNAPTIDLLNVSASAKKGSAVPTSSTEYSVSWSLSPSVSKVNSSSFGVSINYPANTNTNPDIIHLRNVRIVITYTNAVSSSSAVTNINLGGGSSGYISQSDMSNANGRIIVVGSDGSISYVDNNSLVNEILDNGLNVSQASSSVSKSKAYVGETVDITLTISASSKITASTIMGINLPVGVIFKGKKSGNGTVSEGGVSSSPEGIYDYYWIANFSNSKSVSVTFTVQIASIGESTLTFTEGSSNKTTKVKITGLAPSANLSWNDNNQIATIDEPCEIIIESFAQISFERTFTVTFPVGVTVEWEDNDFTVSQQNNVSTITKQLDSNENYFRCYVTFPDVGQYGITVAADNGDTITRTIKVRPSDLTLPYFTKIVADEYVRDRLGNSKEYTLSSLMKLVIDPGKESLIEPYDYNYRLGVFNTNLPEVSTQNLNLIDVGYWRELEGRSSTVTIEDNGVKGNSVCAFGLNTEFANSNYYSLTFDLDTTTSTRVGLLLFGDPSSTVTNKYSWYGIITDIGNTFLESYASDGTASKLYTGSKNLFTTGMNNIKIIRENNIATIYINNELFYTLNNLSDSYNTIGFIKWGSGSVKISNVSLSSDISNFNNYLLENAEWSNPISSANTCEEIQVNFFYSDQYPLIFLITGEYIEANAEEIDIKYTYPCLIETDYRDLAENPGLFEYPIKSIITDEGTTLLDLQPGQVTNVAKLYSLDLSNFLESDEDNRIIQGVTVYFDVLTCDNPISIMAKLSSPSFSYEGNRSLNIESVFLEDDNLKDGIFTGVAALGGSFDLWGLDWDDFKLSNLEGLEIDLYFLNNFSQAVHIEFNNLRIVFHYVELEESKIISKVNGVDLRYLNVFIKDVHIKPGTENDVKYLNVEGTDSNLAYRSNIREKEIEMEIHIPGCDIEETTTFVERLSKLLVNKRNKFNKPILNEIEFNHHPNRVWRYLLEEALDVSAEYTEYEGKIKLVVPSGTSYSKEPTVTNATGTNSGLAKVNPIIRIISQCESDGEIIVKETVSNQEWRLYDDTLSVGDLIRIDCSERKVYLVQGTDDEQNDSDDTPDIDITSKVDFNSDWFLIHDDYNFECENTAIIQSVSFYERWS